MSGTTVIDRLLVELGFDPTEFKKGTKQADAALNQTAANVKKNSVNMGASIARMASQFAVAFLGWKGVQGLMDLNHSASQMGYLAANTGQAVEKVNALGEAMRLSGGQASDAGAILQKISSEQTELRIHGNSGWLEHMQRFGFNMLNADKSAKDTYETLLKLADVFGTVTRPDAFNIGASMGINENQMNFLLQGRKAIEDQVAVQLKQYKLTKAEADAARSTEKSLENLKLKGEHVFRALLTQLRPFIDELATWLGGIQIKPEAVQAGVDALKLLAKGIEFFVDVVKLAAQGWTEIMNTGFGKAMTEMFGAIAEEVHAAANANEKSTPKPKTATQEFVSGLFHPIDTFLKVHEESSGAVKSDARPYTGLLPWMKEKGDEWAAANTARAGNTTGAAVKSAEPPYTGALSWMKEKGDEWAAANTANRAALAAASPGTSSNTTNVHIERMEINTSEKYAPGIAANINSAIKGKVNFVNQSTSGTR